MADRNDLFRAAVGYRMIFVNDVNLPLDESLIPRFKYPKMSAAQRGFAERNLRNIVKGMNEDYLFLFFFVNNIVRSSNMPHIYDSESSSSVIKRLHEIYQDFINSNHDENYEFLRNSYDHMPNMVQKNGKTAIVNGVIDGHLSILSVMRYHSEVERVDLTELAKEKGLLSKRSHRILRQSLRLENHYDFSTKVMNAIRRVRQ